MVAFPVATRVVHVLGMALLLGASVAVWASLTWDDQDETLALARARRYEWVFWGLVAVLVVTGVGNVASLGAFVPGPGTSWGQTFTVKLGAVGGLLVGSLARSALVERCAGLTRAETRRVGLARLRLAYGATGLYLGGLATLAVVLAHG